MSLRSPLGRVLGRGSAKEGVHEWWLQRLTSIALVPLSIGFVASLLTLPSLEYVTLIAWIKHSGTALGLSPGGLGGHGPLLGRRAHRLDLGLSGGRVAEGGYGPG